MRGWLYMLGGLWIWAIHFAAVYACVSLAAQTPAPDDTTWRAVSLAFSAACAAGAAALFVVARRRGPSRRPALLHDVAALCALVGGLAILWQAAAPLYGAS